MKTQILFSVKREGPPFGGYGFSIWAENDAVVSQLAALGYARNPHSGVVTVEDDIDADRLQEAYRMIEAETGMRRSAHRIVPAGERERFFAVQAKHLYTKKEVDSAPWLHCRANMAIATIRDQTDDETFIVESDSRLRINKCRLGDLYNVETLACEETFKKEISAVGFEEILFHPVVTGPGPAAPRPLWTLGSKAVLPPCLHPLTDGVGEPFTGDFDHGGGGCFYDSGLEPALKFRGAEVEAMGPFDFGVTRERTATTRKLAVRSVVVSQRFRQTLFALGIRKMEYTPVLLV